MSKNIVVAWSGPEKEVKLKPVLLRLLLALSRALADRSPNIYSNLFTRDGISTLAMIITDTLTLCL
jgi:hypothetical protein